MPRKTRTRRLRKLKRKKMRKTRNNKMYNMIGCNSRNCDCPCHKKSGGSEPIGGFQIRGGGCFGPLVGSPYSVDKGGNYYELPSGGAYNNPTAYMEFTGGKSKRRKKRMKGGTALPPDLVNVGREIMYGAQSVVNGLGGFKAPTDPAPYVQKNI